MKPSVFTYNETSYFGPTLKLELTESGLRYTYTTMPFVQEKWNEVEVSADYWEIFYQIMMAQPKWKKNYTQAEVCDGVSWELELKYPDRHFKSEGYHNWPPDFDGFLECLGLLGVKELLDYDEN